MIDDDDLLNLPEDPEQAFVQYERKLREYVHQRAGDQGWEVEYDYVSHVQAFLDIHGMVLSDPFPERSSYQNFSDFYADFVRASANLTLRFDFVVQLRRRKVWRSNLDYRLEPNRNNSKHRKNLYSIAVLG